MSRVARVRELQRAGMSIIDAVRVINGEGQTAALPITAFSLAPGAHMNEWKALQHRVKRQMGIGGA